MQRCDRLKDTMRFCHPLLQPQVWGETWAAPKLVIDDDEVRGSVEKELAEKEYSLKKAKGVKGKSVQPGKTTTATAATTATTATTATVAIPIEDDDVWSIPSEGEAAVAKQPGNKAAKCGKEDDAAKAARKAARERVAAWKKEVAKASRCICSLNSVHQSLATTSNKCEKNKEMFSQELMKGMQDALQAITKHKSSALALFVSFSQEQEKSKSAH